MSWWKLKGCPRCKGDVFVDEDAYGWYEQCIQCGYAHDLMATVESGQTVQSEGEGEERPAVQAKGL